MVEHIDGSGAGRGPARPRHRNRVRYALQEFLTVPLAIVVGLGVLAGISAALDRAAGGWARSVHGAFALVVPAPSTESLLTTLTPGLLTVISIIFFVLLMAVQHQSAAYSPVVLDQFLRQRINQVFFGMFVGLTVYCVVTLALVPPGQAVVSAVVALVLSVVTFLLLVVFIYTTVDQMRPSATMWQIQLLAVRAREKQQPLLRRCREQPHVTGAPVLRVRAQRTGYVVHLEAGAFSKAVEGVSDDVEIVLRVAMGDHVVPGSLLAEVRGGTVNERRRVGDEMLNAVTLGRMRDTDRDAAHAVDQLGSMAWAATSASGDPEGARVAVESLHSLLIAFKNQDAQYSAANFGGPLPVVYSDQLNGKIVDALTSVVAAAGPSRQHQTCANVITTLAQIMPDLTEELQRLTIDRLQRTLPTVTQLPFTFEIEQAFESMRRALSDAELHSGAQRVAELEDQLHSQQRLSDPAQEP